MKIFKLIVKIIFSFISTSIIFLGIILTVLFLFKIKPYVVQSGSMEPAIPLGSVCFIDHKYPFEKIKINDIIAFNLNSDKMVTHRVINIKENSITTRGDANTSPDNFAVLKEDFVGKNIFCVPKLGFLINALQTVKIKIMLITILVGIFITNLFYEFIHNKDKKENRRK